MSDAELSPRERQIARAYADGDTYHVIAEQLGIAPSTVRTHLTTVYRKLAVSSKLELRNTLEGKRVSVSEQNDQAALISELALNLDEAISRERALGKVLKIISGSSGDLESVMASVLGYALELCDAEFGILFEHTSPSSYRATHTRGIPIAFQNWLSQQGKFQVSSDTGLGRIAASHQVINLADVRGEDIYRRGDPLRDATTNLGGARSFAAIPMLAGERLIGAFTVYRQMVRPFDAKALELAGIFADQSVIAIENARLLNEIRSIRS